MKRVLTVAVATLALLLTASSAALASAPARTSGTEVITGSTTNLAVIAAEVSVLPVKASGVVNTRGTLALGGPTNGTGTFDFRAGKLNVRHKQTSGGSEPSINPKTCVVSEANGGVYTVTGGTGAFRGATGHGTFKLVFVATLPRLKGKCNTSPSAVPVSGSISFLAFGPLAVR